MQTARAVAPPAIPVPEASEPRAVALPAVVPALARELHPARVRRPDVDLMRLASALLVMTIHVSAPYVVFGQSAHDYGATYWIALAANAISRASVPVFFALAGWAILSRATADDEAAWIGRRLVRLGLPLVIWSAIFLGEAILLAQLHGHWPWTGAGGPLGWLQGQAKPLLVGPGVQYHLWYMYFLIPMTVVIWMIQVVPALRTRPEGLVRTREFVAVGLAAGGIVTAYGLVYILKTGFSWAAVAWAIAYAVLGYILISGPRPPRAVGPLLFLAGVCGVMYVGRTTGYNSWAFANHGPFVFAATLGAIWTLRGVRIPERLHRPLAALASLTFGTYLVHAFILDLVRLVADARSFAAVPGPLRLGGAWVVTVVVSFALVWAWHHSRRLATLLG